MYPSLHGPHSDSVWAWRDIPVAHFQQCTSSASLPWWMVAVGRYRLAATKSFGCTLASTTIVAALGAKVRGFIRPNISALMVEMLRGAIGLPCKTISHQFTER